MMPSMPQVNDLYKHFKGTTYRVVTLSRHHETREILVTYKAYNGCIWTRELNSFLDTVFVNGEFKRRFEKIE